MRTCPTCGEFYEDGPLAFCLADGTPLADVDPSSEKWEEAARAVREKAERLSRHGRRLKWRRVAVRVVTTLLTAVVVCVVVINGVIYLSPPRLDSAANGGPGGGNGNVGHNGNRNDNGGGSNDNGGGDNDNDGGGGGGGNGNDNSAHCSAADQSREWEVILGSCRVIWQSVIEGERPQIIAQFPRRRVELRLGDVGYDPQFSDDCATVTVTARYAWQVTFPTGDVSVPASYAWQVPTPTGAVSVPRTKTFTCRKLRGGWTCG